MAGTRYFLFKAYCGVLGIAGFWFQHLLGWFIIAFIKRIVGAIVASALE